MLLQIDETEIHPTDVRGARARIAAAGEAFRRTRASAVASAEERARQLVREAQRKQIQDAVDAAKLRDVLPKYRLFYANAKALEKPPESKKVDDIIRAVADTHGITVEQIKGIRRNMAVVNARMEACYRIAVARPDMSYPAIARRMGGKDHTTILHAVRVYAERNGLPPVVRA